MLIFEYLSGGTLEERLQESAMSPEATLDLGIALASVLETIHAAGVLHRDIKPSNIGFATDGTAKLLDFGLAHILEDSRRRGRVKTDLSGEASEISAKPSLTLSPKSLTITGQLIGTPAYVSPEAVLRKSPDASFDLWSLNLVLYQSIAGVNPLIGQDVSETLSNISKAKVPDIRKYAAACPTDLALYFQKALSKNRRCRPARAAQMKQELEYHRKVLFSEFRTH